MMKRTLCFLSSLCLVASFMLIVGCGDDEEKKKKKPKPEPKKVQKVSEKQPETPPVKKPETPPVKKPETPPVKKPETPPVKKPETPPVKKPETPPVKKPETPPVKKPETPPVKKPETPPVKPPATAEKVKGPWSDVKVGTMVKMKVAGNMTQTWDVTKVTDDKVTVKITSMLATGQTVPGHELTLDRYFVKRAGATTAPTAAPSGVESKKLPAKKITISGKEYTCEGWETKVKVGEKTMTTRSYTCKDVPGWNVLVETDAMGEMQTTSEVVEFKK